MALRTKFVALLAIGLLAGGKLLAQVPIGVVDVERCLKDYKKADEQRKQLRAELDEKVRAMSEERRKIDALNDSLELYTPGSTEWLGVRKKVALGGAQLQLEKETLQYEIEQKLSELLTKLYEDIRREIKSVAEGKGIKLVFLSVGSIPKARSEADVTNNIMVRSVLYSDPALDLTAEVITRLNK